MARFDSPSARRARTSRSRRVSGGRWVQYQRGDGRASSEGWSGTYTVDDGTVHAVDERADCRIDYAVGLTDDVLTLESRR